SPQHRPSPVHDQIVPSKRTRVRRKPDRGHYDRETIYRILDQAVFGHVGLVADGLPDVTPMVIARRGDELLLHGSAHSRLIRLLATGCDLCVAVTHVDGLIVSRSLFDSSLNYRSVAVFGQARPLTTPGDKLDALRAIVEHVLPGRWGEARPPSDRELRATAAARGGGQGPFGPAPRQRGGSGSGRIGGRASLAGDGTATGRRPSAC